MLDRVVEETVFYTACTMTHRG